jgi:hypothetical protein
MDTLDLLLFGLRDTAPYSWEARKLMEDNLKVVLATFSTLSWIFFMSITERYIQARPHIELQT